MLLRHEREVKLLFLWTSPMIAESFHETLCSRSVFRISDSEHIAL